ncbi:hypothetical protein [Afipia sp. GAS231]|uniref:hypothetical protein n=1 Tax=Afipia sp. GAS231 TaxID=1882747 RepID=UPI00087C0C3E|nr:hypothetical protein [Afipia sp. GAS231]SDO48834.1 hypothetical protein SAMN05444050_4258 [Afipia sp. GAS231]
MQTGATQEFGGNRPGSAEEAQMWREGWGLWSCSDGWLEIQRFDADPNGRFNNDQDAIDHVRSMAEAGSALHIDALALHRTRWFENATSIVVADQVAPSPGG